MICCCRKRGRDAPGPPLLEPLLETSVEQPRSPGSYKQFLEEYRATTIKGWQKIHEHLRKILEQSSKQYEAVNKGCGNSTECEDKCYTRIQYKDLTITILGSITVDQILMILSEWEVSPVYV